MEQRTTDFGTFWFWPQDEVSSLMASGIFWQPYMREWMDQIPLDKVVIDIGAHIGFFSVYMARKGHKVYAFEASKQVFEVLKMNIKANNLEKKITAINAALYDRGDVQLRLNPEWNYFPKTEDGGIDYDKIQNSGGLSLVKEDIGQKDAPILMTSRTLDGFHLNDVGLIKVDTQGCDLRILEGARKTILRCNPILLYEFEPAPARLHGDDSISYNVFLEQIGYKAQELYHGGYIDYVAQPEIR